MYVTASDSQNPAHETYEESDRIVFSQRASSSASRVSSNPNPNLSIGARCQQVHAAEQPRTEVAMLWNPPPPCELLPVKLKDMRTLLNLPPEIVLRYPRLGKDMNHPGADILTIWHGQVVAGLRVPPPPFFVSTSNAFGISVNQISPASFRRAANFCIITHILGHPNPARLFYLTQSCKRQSGVPFYYFVSLTDAKVKFLESNSQERKCYKSRYCFAELVNDQSWATYVGAQYQNWRVDRPIRTEEKEKLGPGDRLFIRRLKKYVTSDRFNQKTLTTVHSTMYLAGLYPLCPPEKIGSFSFLWIIAEENLS